MQDNHQSDDDGGTGEHGHPPPSPGHQLYEVIYVGKVLVPNKKAPPTFIDDAVKKFEEFGRLQKLAMTAEERSLGVGRRHESSTSIQSVPLDLGRVVPVKENELLAQVLRSDNDSGSGSDDAFAGPGDRVLFGGSSGGSTMTRASDGTDISCECNSGVTDVKCVVDSRESLFNECVQVVDLSGLGASEATSTKVSHDGATYSGQHLLMQERIGGSGGQAPKNRTMLIQVGQQQLALISLDHKSIIFERKFKDISFCSQV